MEKLSPFCTLYFTNTICSVPEAHGSPSPYQTILWGKNGENLNVHFVVNGPKSSRPYSIAAWRHLSHIKYLTKSIKADFNVNHFHLFYPQNIYIVLIWMIPKKTCSPFSFLLCCRLSLFTEMKEANNLSCSFFVSKRLKYSIILVLSNSVVLSKHFNLLKLQEGPVTMLQFLIS